MNNRDNVLWAIRSMSVGEFANFTREFDLHPSTVGHLVAEAEWADKPRVGPEPEGEPLHNVRMLGPVSGRDLRVIPVIKLLRACSGLGLKDTKDMTDSVRDSVPTTVPVNMPCFAARVLQLALEEQGVHSEVVPA
jgi:ribosomal protein L7/L12